MGQYRVSIRWTSIVNSVMYVEAETEKEAIAIAQHNADTLPEYRHDLEFHRGNVRAHATAAARDDDSNKPGA